MVRMCAFAGAAALALVGCTFSIVTAPMAFIGLGNTTTIADIIFNTCVLFLVGGILGAFLGAAVGLPTGLILTLWNSHRSRTGVE